MRLRFDARGELIDSYPICTGTTNNCAGGPTPWGTWLTCEEIDEGLVYECDPTGRQLAVPAPALGVFQSTKPPLLTPFTDIFT